jgi:hypothetical protein
MEQDPPIATNLETQMVEFMNQISQRLALLENAQMVSRQTPMPEPTPTPLPVHVPVGPGSTNNYGKIAKKPDSYMGDRKSAKLNAWKLSMETYLKLCEVPEHYWVWTASTYLSGQAATWFSHYQQKTGITTWQVFISDLRAHFIPGNAQSEALDRLSRLRQTNSVESYAKLFRQIAEEISETESKDYEMKGIFVRNLKPEVQLQVKLQDTYDDFTWDKAEEIAIQVDTILYRGGKSERRPLPKSDPVAMDLDNVELQKYREEKRCFKCGQTQKHAPGCLSKYRFHQPKPSVQHMETQAELDDEE